MQTGLSDYDSWTPLPFFIEKARNARLHRQVSLHSMSRTIESAQSYTLSEHAQSRAAQRGVSQEDVRYILRFAQLTYTGNAEIFFLRKVDIPRRDSKQMGRLIGTALITAPGLKHIITIWRNRDHGSHHIRRKRK